MSGPTVTRVAAPVAAAAVSADLSPRAESRGDNDLPMSAVEAQNAERMNVLSKQAQAQAEI
ncbi:MAG: hypothetical protein IPG92_10030, partial [Flavobacteriales bacterium]|nr:hypothetical protein [Flavobacteriales bacterium]